MTATDEHVHNSKPLPELIDGIIKSDKIVDKLFADGANEGNEIFRYLSDKGILPCIKVRKRMLELNVKKETFLGIYQYWHKEMICKSGRMTKSIRRDGLYIEKPYYPV